MEEIEKIVETAMAVGRGDAEKKELVKMLIEMEERCYGEGYDAAIGAGAPTCYGY